MINIIYKIVKPSYLKKLQIIQNTKNLMFQVIFLFSDWILIKQMHSFLHPTAESCIGGNRFSKEYYLGEWIISFCIGRDDKNLGGILSGEGQE